MIEKIKSKIAMTHYFTSTSMDASDDMEKSQPSCSAESKTNDAVAMENKPSIKWFFLSCRPKYFAFYYIPWTHFSIILLSSIKYRYGKAELQW